VSVLDCVDENFSEVESSDSGDKIDENQESDHKSGASVSQQSDRHAAIVSRWHDMKCGLFISCPYQISILHVCALIQRTHNNLHNNVNVGSFWFML
jgi:hypothetical protein